MVRVTIHGEKKVRRKLAMLAVAGDKAVNATAQQWANQVETEAESLVPVRTGRLQDSIEADVSEGSAKVGSSLRYVEYVELGTYKDEAQPFLQPAFTLSEGMIRPTLRDEILDAVGE